MLKCLTLILHALISFQATGCGKTHTISGTEADPGIIYLTMADLFQRIEDRKDDWNVEVMVTFLEIYNEEIRDLLTEQGAGHPRGGLSIREDKAVKVVGLVELKPRTAEEVKEIVLQGNTRRTQSPTHANETSSRSHAVLQVHVTQSPRTASLSEQRTMATLSIIDLAGSERAAATTNMGQRMVEGANINKSLLALGNCINALCESGGAIRHVPYRNSKLTRLLKFSLGGNCKTVMIVCVAPTSNHFDDTHNTLVYAERATKIKTKVVTRNVVNVDRHVGRYVEAINRLNIEIAELKAKLANKQGSESDVVRRRRTEAKAEVERAKNDMQVKADQTRSSIVEGATCVGKMSVAKAKLSAIRTRLSQIDATSSSSRLPADLEAERGLLQALAGPEEQAIKPDSLLTSKLHRSSNSTAMFEATLRAVSERRSEKLDEVSVDNVKLDSRCRKAEMERLKAESERDVMRGAVEDMAEVIIGFVGMLGRCTVMVGEAAVVLSGSLNRDDVEITTRKVATLLGSVKEKNDEAFMKLVGRSTASYTIEDRSVSGSSLDNFKGYGTTFTRRISSGPAILQPSTMSSARRTSLYGSAASLSSPPRRSHRSPRKSLRSSIASQPYRRIPEKEKKLTKGSKNVQWRDEAGQGDLDDGGAKVPSLEVTVIPASPVINDSSDSNSASTSTLPPRSSSSLGSESEWEDENEKTDDSVSLSFMSMSMSLLPSTHDISSSSLSYGTLGTKRPRPSRLDPSFLKSRSKGSTLGSLVEGDETGSPVRRHHPLSDMSMNQLPASDDSGSGGSDGDQKSSGNSLHIPKGRDRDRHFMHGSPGKRGPASPRVVGISAGSGGSKNANGRRRSNIGPMRNDKGRRRSSLIPQLSPQDGEGSRGGARRILLGSPGRRVKRVSLTKTMTMGSLKPKPSVPPIANLSLLAGMDPNTSADMSFNKSAFRPTWR